MEASTLCEIVKQGEDSTNQFKEEIKRADSLAAEMVAFSNSNGGRIIVGVDDHGNIKGLSSLQARALNQLISNASSELVRPAINPISQNVFLDDKIVVIIEIAKGLSKPYHTKTTRVRFGLNLARIKERLQLVKNCSVCFRLVNTFMQMSRWLIIPMKKMWMLQR